jgi:hypothetical protein
MGFSHVLLKIVMYLKIDHALLGSSVFVLALVDEDRSLFYNFLRRKLKSTRLISKVVI